MQKEAILKADVLDIIFEHRNKKYGAYTLRKFYNNRLYKAMGAVFLFAGTLCLLSFFHQKEKNVLITEPMETVMAEAPKDNPIPEKPLTPKPQIPVTATVPLLQKPLSNILITKDPLADNLDSTKLGEVPIKGTKGPVITDGLPEGPITVKGPAAPPTVPAVLPIDKYAPTDFAEVMPNFPGGTDALRRFLEKNLKSPQDVDEGQTITVKMKFIVGYDGALKGFETVEDGGEAFNNEVLRVLKKMPQWIPGKTRGENVSVYYVLPVKFRGTE